MRPYVRQWYHEGGDDTYRQSPATKTLIAKAVEAHKLGGDVVVATSSSISTSKEYSPKAFLKKYPEYKLKKPVKKTTKKPKTKPKTKSKKKDPWAWTKKL